MIQVDNHCWHLRYRNRQDKLKFASCRTTVIEQLQGTSMNFDALSIPGKSDIDPRIVLRIGLLQYLDLAMVSR